MSESAKDLSSLWGIHSAKEDRPAMCDWAKSEEEAKNKMAELRRDNPEDGVSFWVTRLTRGEVEAFKGTGFIPADA